MEKGEIDFVNKIDCRFPYGNRKECLNLIDEALGVSSNAVFSVIEEICRAPLSEREKVSNRHLSELLNAIDERFEHPLKEMILSVTNRLIRQQEISVGSAEEYMKAVDDFPGQYAALDIVYFSCDDRDGKLESLWDDIIARWRKLRNAEEKNNEITIRQTTETDFRYTEEITRETFWDLFKPGCDEHLVLHNLRKSGSFVQELDLVAINDERIVGHIISTRAKVVADNDNENEVLCVGPLSVIPEFQNQGIGSKLMYYCIKSAREIGFSGMLLFGHPDYYHRFGYVNAAEFGITTSEGQNFDPFMALELQPGSLKNISGKFIYDASFEVGNQELKEFEKEFPYREKHVTDTQF